VVESYRLAELASQESYKQVIWQLKALQAACKTTRYWLILRLHEDRIIRTILRFSPCWLHKDYLVAEIWELACLHGSDTRQWHPHNSRTQCGITIHLGENLYVSMCVSDCMCMHVCLCGCMYGVCVCVINACQHQGRVAIWQIWTGLCRRKSNDSPKPGNEHDCYAIPLPTFIVSTNSDTSI